MNQETTTTAAPTGEAMIASARALVPTLRERRIATDEGRRLTDESVQDIRDLGIVGVLTPRQLGGSDLGVGSLLDIVIELARGCGSTAWCGGNFAVHNHLISSFPLEAQQEVFDDPDSLPLVATGFSPLRATTRPEGDGAVVSGQWDFSSGIDFAGWVVVVAMTDRGPLAHLLPTSDVEVIDTWFTMGLRGTGSRDVAAKDLYVPPHRTMLLSEVGEAAGAKTAYELYGSSSARVPLLSIFGAGVIGTILGTAQGAVDVYVERTAEKVGGLSGVKGRERSDVHARIGKSIGDVEAAILVARNCFAEITAVGEADRDATEDERVAWRSQLAWAARLAHGAVERLFEAGGANALRLDDQFGQFYRDNTAGSHHYAIQADTYETARGRNALGLEHGIVGL